ncbi:ubiquitin-conjugating enzyme E2-binding protein [Kalaharituber pfeilii]|nr:ubiquitin-conjugating enzyme E2-binding protein [Kalaharituber pfeilii]
MTSTPLLYAELLWNIRQVSIFVDLPTPANSTTHLEFAPDGASISLHHESNSSEHQTWDICLCLPEKVNLLPNIPPPSIAPGKKDWSKAYPLRPSNIGATYKDNYNYVPWTALDLNSRKPEFCCASCQAEIVKPELVKKWQDLPSYNWAEMMDFWHCHKPHEQGDTEKDRAAKKRHAATHSGAAELGGFSAQQGVGLVDLTFFLLNSKDVVGVDMKVMNADETINNLSKHRVIQCAACGSSLGLGPAKKSDDRGNNPAEEVQETLRLNKWNLCVKTRESRQEKYSSEGFLSAQLMAVIDDQAIRRFRLISDKDEHKVADPKVGLRIWVFHNDRVYSSVSPTHSITNSRSMKVYFSQNGIPKSESLADNSSTGVVEEDIVVSSEAYEAAKEALLKSTKNLPLAMREFRGWKAGSLERFTQPDRKQKAITIPR